MTSIIAYNKCVSFETDLMPFTQKEIKTIMPTISA